MSSKISSGCLAWMLCSVARMWFFKTWLLTSVKCCGYRVQMNWSTISISSLHASSEPGRALRTAVPCWAYRCLRWAIRGLYVFSSSIHQSGSSFVKAGIVLVLFSCRGCISYTLFGDKPTGMDGMVGDTHFQYHGQDRDLGVGFH